MNSDCPLSENSEPTQAIRRPANTPNATASALLAPQVGPANRLSSYELLRRLGQGGMGVVWHARHLETEREVALKVVHTGSDVSPAEIERFRTEVHAGMRLRHPHIVRVFHVDSAEGQDFFTMELLPGGTLADRLRQAPVHPRTAATWLVQAASAIQHAHAHKVLHRDLKPSNLLLAGPALDTATNGTVLSDASWEIKVADFGLARLLDISCRQTGSGEMIGTPSYMAPELIDGLNRTQDERIDVYGLGAVLYACLTGRPPFQASTSPETLLQVLRCDPVPIRILVPSIPPELEAVCLKCLEKDPAHRYASARELADDLQRWLVGKPVQARAPSNLTLAVKWVKRHAVASTLASALVLILLAGVLVSSHFAVTAAGEAKTARTAERLAEDRLEAEQNALARATTATNQADAKAEEATRALGKAQEALDQATRAVYVGQLAHAQREFEVGNPDRGLDLLASCARALRHVEHHHLWTRYSALQTTPEASGGVFALACHPDGTRFALGTGNGSIKVLDARSGQVILQPEQHQQPITGLVFSRDGKRIVSGCGQPFFIGQAGVLKVHDAQTGRKLLEIRAHATRVFSLDLDAAGKRIVSGGADSLIKVHDALTGKELFSHKGHEGHIRAVRFSLDGQRIVSGGEDRAIRVWDAATGRLLFSMAGHQNAVTSLAISPDGKRMASSSYDETVRLWDAATGQPQQVMSHPSGGFLSVQFSPDGKRLVAGGCDTLVRVWDAETGKQLHVLRGHRGPVAVAAYLPQSNRLLSAVGDSYRIYLASEVKVWDAAKGQEGLVLQGSGLWVCSASFTPDGNRVASGGIDHLVRVWNLSKPEEPLILKGHTHQVLAVAWDHAGRRLVSGAYDGTAHVWDATSGKILSTLTGHSYQVQCVAFSPNGQCIVTGGNDKTIRVWDADTGRELLRLSDQALPVTSVKFMPDGQRFLSTSGDQFAPQLTGPIKIWDAESGREVGSLPGRAHGFFCLAVSRDGKRIVGGGADKTVTVWDADTGKLVFTLTGHGLPVTSVTFSPDGQRILSGGGDVLNGNKPGEIKIWDARHGLELLSILGHSRSVSAVDFNHDATRLLSASWDGSVKVWDAHRRQE